ncbi:MAG: GNAT family N-acetyltransferase [Opitutaceae bacterium]
MDFIVRPLTASRWDDLLALFGSQGACYGCWCQYWRMPRTEWRAAKAAGNKAALEAQARAGKKPGLMGYDAANAPAGWVSLGPREDFPGLRNSRFFGDTEDAPGLWSIVCFYVPAKQRGRGIAEAMLAGAIGYARKQRVRTLEAYPWDLGAKNAAVSSLYVGTLRMFQEAGFREVSRKAPHRPVVRLELAR